MISSELRIGNYIKGIGIKPTWLIEGIKGDLIYSLDEWRLLNSFEPILLTEEWLLKFGFDFSVDTWYLKGVAIWETECCNAKGNEEIGFFYELRDVGMMDMNIKYVHQLQNLYFALTGQELIIK